MTNNTMNCSRCLLYRPGECEYRDKKGNEVCLLCRQSDLEEKVKDLEKKVKGLHNRLKMPTNRFIKIKQAAQMFGVSTSTLRIWDNEGRLKANRNENGYRIFDRLEIELIISKDLEDV